MEGPQMIWQEYKVLSCSEANFFFTKHIKILSPLLSANVPFSRRPVWSQQVATLFTFIATCRWMASDRETPFC